MKKNLLVLALPMLLLAACNKSSGPNEGPVSFKKFQRMAYRTINLGIMKEGTFTLFNRAYNVNPETNEIGEYDPENSTSYNFIVNDQTIWYKQGGESIEYILDLENRVTYWKTSSWSVLDNSPTTSEGYLAYVGIVGVTSNQLSGKKNGKYKSNSSYIHYDFKRSDKKGVINYSSRYDLEEEKLTSIERGYYDYQVSETKYYEATIENISYEGIIPEH